MQQQMQQQDEMDNYFCHGIVSTCSNSFTKNHCNLKDFVFETEYCMKKDNYITWIVPLNAEVNDLFIFYNSDKNRFCGIDHAAAYNCKNEINTTKKV